MVFILLVDADVTSGSALRETLGAQGWWVNLVHDREGALRAAADHEPEVVIVSADVPGATELVKIFSSANGGPGTVVLGSSDGDLETLSLVEAGGDEVLSSSPRPEELIRSVQRVAEIPHQSVSSGPVLVGKQFTAEEIFGDILTEVDKGEMTAAAGASEAEELQQEEPRHVTNPTETGHDHQAAVSSPGKGEAEAFELPGHGVAARAADEEEVTTSSGAEKAALAESAIDFSELIEVTPAGTGADGSDAVPDLGERPAAGGTASRAASDSEQGDIESGAAGEAGTETVTYGEGAGKEPLTAEDELAASSFWQQEHRDTEAAVADAPPLPSVGRSSGESAALGDEDAADFWKHEFDGDLPAVGNDSWPLAASGAGPDIADEARDTDEEAEAEAYGEDLESEQESDEGVPQPMLEVDGTSEFGQYRLEKRIAVGGMAEVWRASMVGMEGFQKTVAIKKILPHLAENEEFVAMFVDEAKLAAQLAHENLIDIYDLGKIGNDFFIAMEYVDGKDLRSILNRLRRRQEHFPLGLAVFIAARTAAALDYAHARCDGEGQPLGLVHRDVSPRNILISHNGNIRLCDFGVAKAVSSVARTEIGALKGKIQYMSPEQAAGERVDARSDIYSLGNVLFEMVTGRPLFAENNEISLLDAVRSGAVKEPRTFRADLPDEVNAILMRALEKAPAERYSSAGEMQTDLEEALFRLEPKPTHGALAEWLHTLFESEPEVAAQQGSASPESSPGTQPSAVDGLAASSGEAVLEPAPEEATAPADQEPAGGEPAPAPVEAASQEAIASEEATTAAVSGKKAVADRFKSVLPRLAGRTRFWLGVVCGLIVALLVALAVDSWLSRRAEDRATGPPAVEERAIEPSATVGTPSDGNDQPEADDESLATADR